MLRLPYIFLLGMVLIQHPYELYAREEVDTLNEIISSVNDPEKIKALNKLADKYMESSLEKSLSFANQALEIAEKIQDKQIIADCYRKIGSIYYEVEMYKEALVYYEMEQDLRLDLQNRGDMEETYNLLGNVHFALGDTALALKLLGKSITISKSLNNTHNLGIRHYNIGKLLVQNHDPDSAFYHFESGLEIFRAASDSLSQIRTLVALGQIRQSKNDYMGSRKYFSRALTLASKKNLDYEMAYIAYNVALSFSETPLAAQHLRLTLSLCEENNFYDLASLANNRLAEFSVKNGNYSEALSLKKVAYAYKDSLRLNELQSKVNFLGMKYDYDLKQRELEVLRLENDIQKTNLVRQQRQRQFTMIIIIILLVAIVISIRVFLMRKKMVKSMENKRKQLEESHKELLQSEQNLKNLNDTKNKLFSILAHDLINPFNALLGFATMLNEGSQSLNKEEIKQYSTIIYRTAKSLFQLLENLLQWSRCQTGKIVLQKEPIDLNKLVSNILSVSQVVADKKKIGISSSFELKMEVSADPNLIGIALRNLIQNAIKFTPEKKSIRVRTGSDNGLCFIEVQDTGTGISQEDQKKLFRTDLHFTTKRTSDEQGTGLGLIIAKEFVELNGGLLKVDSVPGKGSTFTIELPRY